MKVPPNQPEEPIIGNSTTVDNNAPDSDDGLNDPPHSPSREGDFSEYLWMENEEEFEQQIMQQLEEEALMQQCIEAMQDEMTFNVPAAGHQNGNSGSSANGTDENLLCGIQSLTLDSTQPSKLNPNAAEFVPRTPSTSDLAKQD